jgi:NADH-quinone oxidoreductase subunit G
MPKLIIDNIPVEVPQGTNVLEAARKVGITIPHFCYHPALAIAAACRLCAVKMLDGPVKGIQMSCSLPAQDGMVVSTTDPEALKMRSLVIEWLMINHPHDCPVCDEGGECLLQDFTIAGGHSRRRYKGKKRTHMNQYLGEGIYHEMNRCIQCYRCARFYQEYAGGTDFGVLASAGRVYFGRFADGPLESPFSGNLVDICPTGVFTDKTARFRARYWDYEYAPSICQHCSVGCNTAPQAFHREVLKIVGRRNDEVNSWFICDRGRFDKEYINGPQRPRDPKLDGAVCGYDEALDALASRISDFIRVDGTGSIAFVGSGRLSLEGCIMLAELSQLLDGSKLSFFADAATARVSQQSVKTLNDGNVASPRDLETADCIALVSLDLMEEAAMLAPPIRKASMRGGQVFYLSPEGQKPAHDLPFSYSTVTSLKDVPLKEGAKSVFIYGAGHQGDIAADDASTGAKVILLQPGPNAFGAAMLALQYDAVPLDELLAEGKLKAVVSFEADLPANLPAGVTLLAAADWAANAAVEKAGIFLPTTTWAESDGTSINFEGRAQRFQRAFRPGIPIRGLDAKYYGKIEGSAPLHPPRIPRGEPPGGQERYAWKVMAELHEKLGGERITDPLPEKWSALKDLDPEGGGVRVLGMELSGTP